MKLLTSKFQNNHRIFCSLEKKVVNFQLIADKWYLNVQQIDTMLWRLSRNCLL